MNMWNTVVLLLKVILEEWGTYGGIQWMAPHLCLLSSLAISHLSFFPLFLFFLFLGACKFQCAGKQATLFQDEKQ